MIDLRQGDCLELLKDIPDGSVDMVMTDMPYGTTQCKWDTVVDLDALWVEVKRITKPNAAIVMTAAQPFTTTLISSNIKEFRYCWVWEKSHPTGFLNAKIRPMVRHEDVVVFYKRQCVFNRQFQNKEVANIRPRSASKEFKKRDCYGEFKDGDFRSYPTNKTTPQSVIKINSEKRGVGVSRQHPTQKPVALMEYLIKTYTNEQGVVIDMFMGSGSTGVAAINTNRKFIGIELDPDYFKIAEERINQAAEKGGFLMPII